LPGKLIALNLGRLITGLEDSRMFLKQPDILNKAAVILEERL
jgi:hypothetical protein